MKILVLLCVIFLTGCTTRYAYNPNKPYSERQKDYAECQYEADKHTEAYVGGGLPGAFQIESKRKDLWYSCLKLRGYAMYLGEDIDKIEAIKKAEGKPF